MATDTAKAGEVIPPPDAPPTAISSRVAVVYESMLASVPDAGGDGLDGILEAIALATDLHDLDAPWRVAGLDDVLNQQLVVTGIRKMPSDYAGGLAWFLILDGAIRDTGETISITTGSVSVVAQLVKAHQLGAFPLIVIPRQSDRPSAAGYYPQHLQIVGPVPTPAA